MQRDDNVVVFGEDVGYFGGVFRCTQGLQQKFGANRVFDTPISELGIVGAAVGMAAYGLRPCVEIQFADYMYPAYDQIVSEAARLRYRSNGQFTAPIGRAHADRRRHFRRPDPQPESGGAVHPCRRPENRRALQPLRRQGPADRGDRGQRSGDLSRAQAALQRPVRRPSRAAGHAVGAASPGRGPGRPLHRSPGQGRHSSCGLGRDGAGLRHHGLRGRSGRRRDRHRCRDHRSAHARSLRPRDHRRRRWRRRAVASSSTRRR